MSELSSETHIKLLTICDDCCELLGHNINFAGKTIEMRVESCPKCCLVKPGPDAEEIIRGLLDCPDLNLDSLEEETIHQIDKATKWLLENKRS
jgi:hypothetical protein